MQSVTLKLPEPMLQAAAKLAAENDITIGQIVRDLLAREMQRKHRAKRSEKTDEQLLASLQTLLASDMADAKNWGYLASRLAGKGYELRPASGGLTLNRKACGTKMCKASELGFAYGTLVKRFGKGMPGHPHGGMPGGIYDAPGIDLIERD